MSHKRPNQITSSRLAAGLLIALASCSDQAIEVDDGDASQPALDDSRLSPVKMADQQALLGANFRMVREDNDDLGLRHVRVAQEVGGVPVVGGDAIIHYDQAGQVYAVTGTRVSQLNVNVVPTITAAQAKEALRTRLADLRADFRSNTRGATDLVQPTLAIVPTAHGDRLVWMSNTLIDHDSEPAQLEAMVDAHTGEIVQLRDVLETAGAIGTGKSLYSGTVALATNTIAGGFAMRDTTRGNGFTATMKNRSGGKETIFTDTDNVWGNSLTSDAASAGVDAHYGMQQTFDYYRSIHGRNGIANDGAGSFNRVHYGRNYNNAYWSDSCFCMTFGDGDGATFTPLTSIDVAGHEMSHGVTARTAALTYSGESGGLNEATSDIFGTATEFFANNANDPGDYLIGEKITLRKLASGDPGTGKYLRSMIHPRFDGGSIDHYSQFTASLDVHYSSGIANNFFYLLSEGGTNDTSGMSVTGITRAKAERIWYRALTVYFTSGTTFAAARVATVQAANDLFGSGSAESTAVAATWTAVGVN